MLRLTNSLVLLLVLSPVALKGQQITQVSPMDSLVTWADLNKACLLRDLLPPLPAAARGNVEESRATVRDIEADPEWADPAERAGLEVDLAQARMKLARNEAGITEAETQLAEWRNGLSDEGRANIQAYCELSGSSSGWDFAGVRIPSRTEIKAVAAVNVTYNPNNVALGATPGVFLSLIGIDEAEIASGLTSFLMDRAAQEIQLAFIDRFKKWACEGARKVMFESTCGTLGKGHLALHSSVLRELNASIEADLRRLPRSAPLSVVGTDGFKNALGQSGGGYTTSQQDLILAAYFVGSFLERMIDGAEPPQALADLLDLDTAVVDAATKAGLLTDALATAPDGVIVHPVTSGLYRLALVGKVLPEGDDGGIEWPSDAGGRTLLMQALAVNASGWAAELGVTSTPEAKTIIAMVTSLMAALDDSHTQFDALKTKVGELDAADRSTLAKYAAVIDDALAIAEVWAELIDTMTGNQDGVTGHIASLRGVAKSLTANDYSGAILGIYTLADDIVGLGFTLPEGTIRFLSFATALAQAESASETAQVIQSYAAPVQSYRAKRNGERWYLLINGYLGGSFGWESAAGVNSNFVGVSAPFGLELGGPIGKGWSLGLFGQVLDVGVLASFRITSDDEQLESEPEIGLGQVFSPGAYAVLGLPSLPVAVGFGWSFAPALRKVSDTTDETENATRWNFFLSVDIPVLVLR